MTVGLALIVKNEAERLGRLAESVAGLLDAVTIVDTGSSDGTMDVARRVFAAAHPLVTSVAWEGFAPARNAVLELAAPRTDWVLHMDADETLVGYLGVTAHSPPLADCLTAETHSGSLRYWVPRLMRSSRSWRWVGRTHEYLELDGARVEPCAAFHVEHHADGGSRGDKFFRDLELLRWDWDDDPQPRTAFYLARTYDDIGRVADAEHWYRFRAAMGGWDEEIFYSLYRLGCLLLPDDEGAGALWRAWGMRPHRLEPLVALAQHYRGSEDWQLAWLACTALIERERGPSDLFVDIDAEWRLLFEASIAGWYVGEPDMALTCWQGLAGRELPENYAAALRNNAAFYPSPPTL
jgi:glycosyltransferase involved in cell wall biosynthesis